MRPNRTNEVGTPLSELLAEQMDLVRDWLAQPDLAPAHYQDIFWILKDLDLTAAPSAGEAK